MIEHPGYTPFQLQPSSVRVPDQPTITGRELQLMQGTPGSAPNLDPPGHQHELQQRAILQTRVQHILRNTPQPGPVASPIASPLRDPAESPAPPPPQPQPEASPSQPLHHRMLQQL
ncbi:hypothetical protein BO71DRAFT_434670 [Aspergillus ellipticus CBS 707.79]|uniref:Uncharacterized protein n=1 Tax=Aspergillus ellipticus CBS 707.79 TaxID=1448320 RepID=A0A319D509_9EURO|nr:hypothetical protein BO71DRAFT_434670 [Aspergillus ellipticus CBS 707.79]